MRARFLLLTALIAGLSAAPTFAAVTPDEMSAPEYMRNEGYSEALIDMTEYSKASSKGQKYVSMEQQKLQNMSKGRRFFRKFLMYVDPALDDGKFMNHDIKQYPSPDDL